MKILGLTTSYPRSPGDDSSIFVHRLYRALAKAAEVEVAAPSDGAKTEIEVRDGVAIRWFEYIPFVNPNLVYGAGLLPNLKRKPWAVYELPILTIVAAIIARRAAARCDIVHANWIIPGLAACLARLCGGRPYVVTLRGSDTMLFSVPGVRQLSGFALRRAAAVTVVSEQMRRETIAAFPWLAERCTCIENGVEPEPQGTGKVPSGLPETFLLAVGSVIPRKRVELAIRMISLPQLAGYSLVICGKTEDNRYLERLREAAQQAGVASRVHFLGPLPPADLWATLGKAAAFIACSSYEGRPNAMLEALYSRIPVVASDIPAHMEVLKGPDSGILFNESTLEDAAGKLAALLSNPDARSAMTAAGNRLVEQAGWSRCAGQYLEVFSSAAARDKPHGE